MFIIILFIFFIYREKAISKVEGNEQQNPKSDLPRIVQVLRQKRNADPDFHHYYYSTILQG